MRPTRLGWGCLFLSGLTLVTAASTGNNLLYVVYSLQLGLLGVAALGGRLNLRGVVVEPLPPAQVYRGEPFRLTLRLRHASLRGSFGLEAHWQGSAARVERLPFDQAVCVDLRGIAPHRGLNALGDLEVRSSFPFGLFEHELRMPAPEVLALPRGGEVRDAAEVADRARATGRPTLRKGSGDELYGVREYGPGDDARSLNWKLSARLGRPLVNEYCSSQDDRITVSVDAGRGPEAEKAIERAAAACRFHIGSGAQVRLESAEETVEYGRGLSQLERLLRALARLGEGRAARPAGARVARAPAGESQALRRLTTFGLFLVLAGMFLVDEVDPRLVLWLFVPLLLGAAVQERRWRLLPEWAENAVSALMLAGVMLVDWRVTGVTVANMHLLLYLLVNRALVPLERKDLPQVFLIQFLAFFLASGLTISLWYFALLLGFSAYAAAWMSLASGSAWADRRRWLPGAAGAVGAAFAAALLVFTATPRVEGLRRINPFLAAGIDKLSVQRSTMVGFNDGVSLGFYGRLHKSSARVMRLQPLPPPALEPGPVYVRGAAFDRFDGRSWTRTPVDFAFVHDGRRYVSARHAVWPARRGDMIRLPASTGPSGGRVYDVAIYPMSAQVVFTVGTPWIIEGAQDMVSLDHTDSLRFASAYLGGAHYRVRASADSGFGATLPGYEKLLGLFLQLPPDPDGKLAALAREVTAGAGDPHAKAVAVAKYLSRFDYSLYSDGADLSLQSFLFKKRKGNCEYFATAAAVLLRQAGVPTRVVTGFLAEDWNEYGKFYDVRQGQAHAWVELYVPGQGWVGSDPTPPQSLLSSRAEALSRRLEHWFSAAQAGWYRHVIGYDQYVQRDTFRRLSAALKPEAWRSALRGLGLGALLALGFAAAGLGLARLRRFWAAAPPSLLESLEAAALGAGLARQAHWTAREFGARLLSVSPALSQVPALVTLHELDRFSGRGLSEAQREEARRLLRELKTALESGGLRG